MVSNLRANACEMRSVNNDSYILWLYISRLLYVLVRANERANVRIGHLLINKTESGVRNQRAKRANACECVRKDTPQLIAKRANACESPFRGFALARTQFARSPSRVAGGLA